jgi:arylsulfatase A-like enzyme
MYLGNGANAEYHDDPVFQNKGPWNRGKFITTNGGVITPFIAWGPGRVPSGKSTDRAINHYDFMATAAELSGARLPGPTEGVSYVPLLEGRDGEQPLRNVMEWTGASCRFTPGIPDDWAEKKDKKRYKPDAVLLDEKWYAMRLGETVRLFDIMADPGMQHDLSAENPGRCARAMVEFQRLRAWETEASDQ